MKLVNVVCLSAAMIAVTLSAHGSAAPFPLKYEELSGCAKQDFIWNQKILPTQYSTLPELEGLDIFGFNSADMKVTVDRVSDEMPAGRTKYIHKRGSVVKVAFVAESSTPFTGLFRGASCGLMRVGMAIKPGGLSPVVPGASFKFFVDGQPSRNFPAMPSLDGQGKNYNFFALPYLTSISEPKNFVLKILKGIFERASKKPTQLSLNHLSTFQENGVRETARKAPAIVSLEASASMQFPEQPARDNRLDFVSIPSGTEMFDVYDYSTGSKGALIGKVVSKSEFVASSWGDDGLFFKHQRMEDAGQD